jgi:alpha-L-fucosidase
MRQIALISAYLLILVPARLEAQYQANWTSLDKRQVPAWYLDAKFGIFIHWGVYSVPAWSPVGSYAEWYQHALVEKSFNGAVVAYHQRKFGDSVSYYDLANRFKAELFNPDAWADLIQKSGAMYVVLTSKHHDGFCLWPSPEADRDFGFPWNATEVGPHQDLVGELFTALRKTRVHPGLYYSLYEWYDPLYLKDKDKYVMTHSLVQMRELINNYHPDVLWTDGDWDLPPETWHSQEFLAWLYNESPVKDNIVTYDRWGSGVHFNHGGVFTPEYQPNQDFSGHPFEESQGMGYSYGYNRAEDSWDYNTAQALVLELCDLVSRGGNFLLDIGPDSHGKIPPIMEERLLQIGSWLSVNGEAIYGSRTWKIPCQWSSGTRDAVARPGQEAVILKQTVDPDSGQAVKEIFFTWKPDTLYAILPRYPVTHEIVIRNLHIPGPATVHLLATGVSLQFRNVGQDAVIQLPPYDPSSISTPYAYAVRIAGVPGFEARPVISVNYPEAVSDPVISISGAGDGRIYYTTDGTEPGPGSFLYSGAFTLSHSGILKAIAISADKEPSDLAVLPVRKLEWLAAVKLPHPQPGIRYRYYEPGVFTLAVMDTARPVKTGIVPVISLAAKGRPEKFCMSFDGFLKIPRTGIYRLSTISDDGSDLWIDEDLIVNNDGDHGNQQVSANAALKAGMHRIRVRYFDSGGNNSLEIHIQPEGETEKAVNASMLFH